MDFRRGGSSVTPKAWLGMARYPRRMTAIVDLRDTQRAFNWLYGGKIRLKLFNGIRSLTRLAVPP